MLCSLDVILQDDVCGGQLYIYSVEHGVNTRHPAASQTLPGAEKERSSLKVLRFQTFCVRRAT